MRSPRRPKGRALSSHPRTTPHNAPFSNPQVAYRPLLAAASFNPQRLELDIGAFVGFRAYARLLMGAGRSPATAG